MLSQCNGLLLRTGFELVRRMATRKLRWSKPRPLVEGEIWHLVPQEHTGTTILDELVFFQLIHKVECCAVLIRAFNQSQIWV